MLLGAGGADVQITEEQARELSARALDQAQVDERRVLVVIPDSTRVAPIDLFFRILEHNLAGRVKQLDFLVALGTHPPMTPEQMARRVGITVEDLRGKYRSVRFFNHDWENPEELAVIGTISAEEIESISEGRMRESVPVTLNRRVLDYDLIILLSPVVPHEVAGFSGGNKYLFPGIAGPEILHFFHWLAAVITNPVINGSKQNPVRRVLDRAASFLRVPVLCFGMVVHEDRLKGLFIGSPEDSWAAAADLSSKLHIRYLDRPYSKVLGITPVYYDDLWVGGKVMYKLEPILEQGADLIIYAPHIREVSFTHGRLLREIGYHVRDYFLHQMDKFPGVPRGILAHSTHVRGVGTFEDGVERPRANVILATGIPAETCRQINLGYMDPRSIDPDRWRNRESEGILVVDKAGGDLYRLRSESQPAGLPTAAESAAESVG